MNQPGLFDDPVIPVNRSVHPKEAPRLSRQSIAILERLRTGVATNAELARIGIRYSARIGEMRAVGYKIEIIERHMETGLNVYKLVGEP